MNEKQNNAIAMVTIRLAAIQPAVNGTFPDMNKQAYYARIAQYSLKLPDLILFIRISLIKSGQIYRTFLKNR